MITLSTVESEYLALIQAMRELLPMREFLEDLQKHMDVSFNARALMRSTVFEDNNGCISTAMAPKLSPRTKHIGVKWHFFKSHLSDNKEGCDKPVILEKIKSEHQLADIFTKGLGWIKFQALRSQLCGW